MSILNGPEPDDKPSIIYIKIKMNPKGEINIGVNGGDPNGYHISVKQVTPKPNTGEPNCTNTPFNATWDGSQYVGTGTFNGALIAGVDVYGVQIEFINRQGGSEGQETHSASVIPGNIA